MSILKWSGRALCVAVLAGSLTACDFIQPITENPNQVPAASLDQILVGSSVNFMRLQEGQSSRLVALWLQQMAGNQRQFSGFDTYQIVEGDDDDYMNFLYDGGGLVALREGQRLATTENRIVYRGIFKVYEAFMMGEAASQFGDLPYSEAINPEIDQPVLDGQLAIYTAVLALLDDAITDLNSGTGAGPGNADFFYGGTAANWVRAAHSLKARFNLHWVEVEGNARYTAAIAEANLGILSAADDWTAIHTTAATETFFWYQFMRDRSGYIMAGDYGVSMMQAQTDPRTALYYSEATGPYAGTIIGSPPGTPSGDPSDDASELTCGPNKPGGCTGLGLGSPEFDFPILTCSETNFILAEATLQTGGGDAAARTFADAALDCDEARWAAYGYTIDLSGIQARNDALTGAALLDEIMLQKYISMPLRIELWNDYKRTCWADNMGFVPAASGAVVPGRFLYSQNERQTNVNVPDADQQPARNANDPAACAAAP
jgi:hypothetical protein